MAIRRKAPTAHQVGATVTVDGLEIPAELLDENHPVWGGKLLPHREAARAFAIEQGWVRHSDQNPHPIVDWTRLEAAGIPVYDCARLTRERHPDIEWGGTPLTKKKES